MDSFVSGGAPVSDISYPELPMNSCLQALWHCCSADLTQLLYIGTQQPGLLTSERSIKDLEEYLRVSWGGKWAACVLVWEYSRRARFLSILSHFHLRTSGPEGSWKYHWKENETSIIYVFGMLCQTFLAFQITLVLGGTEVYFSLFPLT